MVHSGEMSQRDALLTEFFAKQKTRIKTMMKTNENAISTKTSPQTRREHSRDAFRRAFAMPRPAERKNATPNTPPLSHKCIATAAKAQSALKNREFGATNSFPTFTKHEFGATNSFPTLWKHEFGATNSFPTLWKYKFGAQDASALFGKCEFGAQETNLYEFCKAKVGKKGFALRRKHEFGATNSFPTFKKYKFGAQDASALFGKCEFCAQETNICEFCKAKLVSKSLICDAGTQNLRQKYKFGATNSFTALKEHKFGAQETNIKRCIALRQRPPRMRRNIIIKGVMIKAPHKMERKHLIYIVNQMLATEFFA